MSIDMTQPNLKLRYSTPRALRDIMQQILKGEDGRGLLQNCLNCHHFEEAANTCHKYRQTPPARIIINGCDGYDDIDDIPF